MSVHTLRGASAESTASLADELAAAVDGGADGDRVAEDLFGVAALLASEASLRRVLTDPSVGPEPKQDLVRGVLGARLDSVSLDIVVAAVARRWAGTRDLGDALEHLGVVAVVRAAEGTGQADALEDQLFALSRLVNEHPALRDALSDPSRPALDKRQLLRSLLGGRVTPGVMRLAEQATSGSHRTVLVALDSYQKVAAEQRRRLAALVTVAKPLDAGEQQRLTGALSAQYGRPVHLNVVVDRDVLGGVRVEIGHDVIDGTVASRLDDARRRLAG